MAKDKVRFGIIDLYRFIGCLLIMGHHCYHIQDKTGGGYYVGEGWIFVEWYYIIMGYFTCKHFINKQFDGNAAKNSMVYTWIKFKGFLPYVLITVSIEYVYEALPLLAQGVKPFLKSFYNMPFEVLLLSDSIVNEPVHVVPLWFLSSAFLVFPWFCCVMQMKDKYMLTLISWTVPVVYYGYVGVIGGHPYPINLFRTLAGLMLGAFIYFVSIKLSIFNNIGDRLVFLLTFIECSSLLFVLISVLRNWQHHRLNLMAFAIANILMFSGLTATSKIEAEWMVFLGKISMPLFIMHWSIGTAVNYYFSEKPYANKVLIYYIGTFVIAISSYFAIEYLKNIKKVYYKK